MLSIFNGLRGLSTGVILFRMVLAFICGAVIGMERSVKNRPAGFRTHILICIGAATAAVTGHYIYLVMRMPADTTRLPAQVITGLGFIGAGTIIVTGARTVKGLTTAAGLWTTGVIGLAIGSGFYEGAIIGMIMVLVTETLVSKIKVNKVKQFQCILHYQGKEALDNVMRYCKDRFISINSLQIEGATDEDSGRVYTAIITLRPYSTVDHDEFAQRIEEMDGILGVVID